MFFFQDTYILVAVHVVQEVVHEHHHHHHASASDHHANDDVLEAAIEKDATKGLISRYQASHHQQQQQHIKALFSIASNFDSFICFDFGPNDNEE